MSARPRTTVRSNQGNSNHGDPISPVAEPARTPTTPTRSLDDASEKEHYDLSSWKSCWYTAKKRGAVNAIVALLVVIVLFQVALFPFTNTNSTENTNAKPNTATEKARARPEKQYSKGRREEQAAVEITPKGTSAPALDTATFYKKASQRAVPQQKKPSGAAATILSDTNHNNNHNNFTTLPPAKKMKVGYPIFVASFSKSGTTSTFYAFSCYLGFDYVAHRWTNDARKRGAPELIGRCVEQNVEEHKPPFEGCGIDGRTNQSQTVVWSDTSYIGGPHGCYHPPLDALDEIWEAYPHATLLLVRRNATAWYHSANSRRAAFIQKWTARCPQMPNQRKEDVWVEFYHNYTQRVRDFAQARRRAGKPMTYVEVELESPDTGRILEEEMGLPRSCWKHCVSSFAMRSQDCKDLTNTTTRIR